MNYDENELRALIKAHLQDVNESLNKSALADFLREHIIPTQKDGDACADWQNAPLPPLNKQPEENEEEVQARHAQEVRAHAKKALEQLLQDAILSDLNYEARKAYALFLQETLVENNGEVDPAGRMASLLRHGHDEDAVVQPRHVFRLPETVRQEILNRWGITYDLPDEFELEKGFVYGINLNQVNGVPQRVLDALRNSEKRGLSGICSLQLNNLGELDDILKELYARGLGQHLQELHIDNAYVNREKTAELFAHPLLKNLESYADGEMTFDTRPAVAQKLARSFPVERMKHLSLCNLCSPAANTLVDRFIEAKTPLKTLKLGILDQDAVCDLADEDAFNSLKELACFTTEFDVYNFANALGLRNLRDINLGAANDCFEDEYATALVNFINEPKKYNGVPLPALQSIEKIPLADRPLLEDLDLPDCAKHCRTLADLQALAKSMEKPKPMTVEASNLQPSLTKLQK